MDRRPLRHPQRAVRAWRRPVRPQQEALAAPAWLDARADPADAPARRRRRRAVEQHAAATSATFTACAATSTSSRSASNGRRRRIRASRADFGLPADAFVLVTVGRLVARKQTTQLVAAMARSGVAHAHLLVVGGGPDEAPIRAAAAAHGVAGRVHLLGSLGEVDKYRAHRGCRRLRVDQPARRFRSRVPGGHGHGPAGHLLRPRRADRLSRDRRHRPRAAPERRERVRATRSANSASRAERCRQFGEFNRARVEEFFIDRCAERYEAVMQRAIDARAARSRG